MSKVLIVDDDPGVCASLTLALGGLGHSVNAVAGGAAALSSLRADPTVDVVILDVMMPEMDGFQTCRELRGQVSTPVIMLTARSDSVDVIVGLECGADDYVIKPVEPRLLDARIKAVLRRAAPDPNGHVLMLGAVRIDRRAMTVTRAGAAVNLTPTEMRLMLEFVAHPGQAMTRRALLNRVWDYGYLGDSRIVDACVQRLRAKIEAVPAQPELIVTVRGVGYRLAA